MRKWSLLVLFSFSLTACGGYKEWVVQRSDEGFLKFVGNVEDVVMSIDGGENFPLKRPADFSEALYKIPSGRHNIKLYRGGNMIVDRIVLIDNGVSREVVVP